MCCIIIQKEDTPNRVIREDMPPFLLTSSNVLFRNESNHTKLIYPDGLTQLQPNKQYLYHIGMDTSMDLAAIFGDVRVGVDAMETYSSS